MVKQFVRHCLVCRKAEGGAYRLPVPPTLPSFRVRRETPFAYTGIDFAGPLFVTTGVELESKMRMCLFTCCSTRAVHLDVVNKLSVDCFLRCFRRFVSTRGLPQGVNSDHDKTFKGAAEVLWRIMSHPEVTHYFVDLNITWSFNVEKAPWWGGGHF